MHNTIINRYRRLPTATFINVRPVLLDSWMVLQIRKVTRLLQKRMRQGDMDLSCELAYS